MPRLLNPLDYSAPENVYAGAPIDEVKALNKSLSEQYTSNRLRKDQLDILAANLDVRDVDYQAKKQYLDGLKSRFQDLVDRGDYENAKYIVGEEAKKFDTDPVLKGIVQSRQKELAYKSDLDKRLAEGKVDKYTYNYGLIKSKLANKDALTYNPETGTYENMYSGFNVLDDASKEIYENFDKRIQNWKEGSILDVDGHKFTKVKGLGGVEKVYMDGVEVKHDEVYNALRRELEGTPQYMAFLQQQRDIDNFNKFADAEGNLRDVNRDDLKFLQDSEIRSLLTGGITEDMILKAEKEAKTLDQQAAVEDAKNRFYGINLDDPETIKKAYDSYQYKSQIDKYVAPASDKASYEKWDSKLFQDNAALENIKASHSKALKKYEYDLQNMQMPLLTNKGSVQKYTGDEYKEIAGNLKNYQAEVNKQKALLDQLKPGDPLYETRKRDYENAVNTLNGAKTHIQQFFSNLSDGAKKKLGDRIRGMFHQEEGGTSNWDYRPSKEKMEELMNIAHKNGDRETWVKLATINQLFEEGKTPSKDLADDLSNRLTNEKYLPSIAEIDEERTNRSTVFGMYDPQTNEAIKGVGTFEENRGTATQSGYMTEYRGVLGGIGGMIGGTVFHHTKLSDNINDIMQEEFNTNQNMKTVHDLYFVPDQGKDNTPLANSYHAASRALLKNSSDLQLPNGKSLNQLLAGQTEQKFWTKVVDKKGKETWVEATPDLEKSLTAVAPGSADGDRRVAVTFKDKDGNDLILAKDASDIGEEEKDAMRKEIYLKSGNPAAVDMLYNIAGQVATASGDKESAKLIYGEVNFSNIFRTARLGEDSEPFYIKAEGKELKEPVMFKKISDDASIIVSAKTGKSVFQNSAGQPKAFRSQNEVIKAFQEFIQSTQ